MLAQAAGFAFLAALSPTSLLVMTVFMGSANPRRTVVSYVTGAIVMSVAMGVGLLLVIRSIGLDEPRQRDPRYGLRIALGVLALAAAIVVFRRRRRLPGPGDSESGGGLMSRLVSRPSVGTAFVAGIILFAPSTTFIAAVQVIATARASVPATVLALVIVVVVSVLIVWLPLVAFLLAPEATMRRLGELNGWLRVRGKAIAAWALVIGGTALLVNGILGVTGR
jgi:hypothetical protein